MNRIMVILLGVVSLLFVKCSDFDTYKNSSLAHMVNPFIGTDYTGNTYPGAQVPFGMVQLSPDNGMPGWDRIAGYYYPDSTIAGFSHTHLSGTGAGDLYDISFMPTTLPYVEAEQPLGIYSTFSHDDESAYAGYYQVRLSDYDINVELTATERCGIQRYTFPKSKAAIFLNLKKAMNWDFTEDSQITVVDSVTIEGYRHSTGWARGQKLYFRTRFSKPFNSVSIDTMSVESQSKHIGTSYVARFDFDTREGEQILLYTALSATGSEGAIKNFEAEIVSDDFDYYVRQAEQMWNNKLSCFEVETENSDDIVTFYTALYHTMVAPTIYNDVDGAYRGPDKRIHQSTDFTNYSTFSLWDTYRASHPLFTYTSPEETVDMVESLLAFYDQNGRLPVWNFQGSETDMMIGHHAIPVIVDAYLKGIGNFNAERALEACISTANNDDYRGVGLYKKYGYIPYNLETESLSKTLEYGYNDYCIARMAEKMGRDELAKEYYRRGLSYRNLYNPETSFIQPRDDKGEFIADFDAKDYTEHITESNGWQYFWYAPHDVEGLISLVGGKERFVEKLDSMFTYNPTANDELPIFSTGMIGQYAHGNEPSHHIIYLYNAVGQPWKSQKYASQVVKELYANSPDGLCGNEDCGQMSAWYVFSAMGFYPVNPVGGQYELGTPLFSELKLKLENGKIFTVKTKHHSPDNIYVKSLTVDGKPYELSYITHQQIMEGAVLEFEMSDKPNIPNKPN